MMRINYCMQCADTLVKHDDTCYECADGHQYFNNPRCGTSVVILRDGEVLLAKRRIQPRQGDYCFPGGFLQYGEEPVVGAQREVREETGLEANDLELLHVSTLAYVPDETSCSIVFLARDWRGTPRAHDDAEALVWKPLSFIESDQFAWHYPGLLAKLEALDSDSR